MLPCEVGVFGLAAAGRVFVDGDSPGGWHTGVGGGIWFAFVFGSMAKGMDTGGSDVDLMVVSDGLTYAAMFGALETASSQLTRQVSPTIYTSAEFERRIEEHNPFLTKILEQPRIWIIGKDDDLSKGFVDVEERLVEDLLLSCRAVQTALDAIPKT